MHVKHVHRDVPNVQVLAVVKVAVVAIITGMTMHVKNVQRDVPRVQPQTVVQVAVSVITWIGTYVKYVHKVVQRVQV